MSTPTQRFSDAFDPLNERHVRWLAKFFEYGRSVATDRTPIEEFINKNPMGVKLNSSESLEWVHIHFCLAMKYADKVLKCQAWVPSSNS
jgi:hypothetical protein